MSEVKMKLSPPWITYVNEIEAMFGEDPDIKITYNYDEKVIKMFVDNEVKADALAKLLPMEKEFGNVKVALEIVPSDKEETPEMIYRNAFAHNPNFSFAEHVDSPFGFSGTYVVFSKKIAQFFNDDISDYYGNKTMLIKELADELLEREDGVYFCTEGA